MKLRWVLVFVVALFALPALACASGTPTPKVERQTQATGAAAGPSATSARASGAAHVGDTATQKGYALTLHAVKDPTPAGDVFGPQAGNRWVALDVEIAAKGDKPINYNPLYAKVKDTSGHQYNVTVGGVEPTLKSGELPPGQTVRGWLTFELPQDAQLSSFNYAPIDFSGVNLSFDLK